MELEKDLERIQRLFWKSLSSRIQELPVPGPLSPFQPSPVWDSWCHPEQIQQKKKKTPLEFCSQERKPRQAEDLKGIKVKFLEEAANYPGPRGCAGSGGIGVGESGWDQGLWERGSRGEGIALGFLSVIPGFHCQASPGASREAPRVGGGEEEVEGEIFVE